jgi:uncharacterized protein YndB with AHSA1/START domain
MEPIHIDITILAPVQKVWDYYNEPEHITNGILPTNPGNARVLKTISESEGSSKTEWKPKIKASDSILWELMMK